jgi:hypothetical protein
MRSADRSDLDAGQQAPRRAVHLETPVGTDDADAQRTIGFAQGWLLSFWPFAY